MAYTASVTLDLPKAERIGRRLGMITGTVNITEYNTTLVEITDITKHFEDTTIGITVNADGATDEGYVLSWSATDKALKAWQGDYSTSTDGPLTEVSNGTDVGAAKFIAVGLCRW